MKITHGGDIYSHKSNGESLLDFSANINPLGIAENVKEAMINSLSKAEAYPDPLCRELTAKLSKHLSVNAEHIIFGNGAADVIFRLIFALKPKKVLMPSPTFSEYSEAVKAVGGSVNYYPLKEENGFEIEADIISFIDKDTDIVFICNPNNPTGVLTDKSIIKKVLNRCRECGSILLLDECFNDFLKDAEENSLIKEIEEYKNLFILRAFTKIYAIPGIRLGYGICSDKELINKVYSSGQSWSVSVVAQEAGVSCIGLDEYIKETVALVEKEREYLKSELLKLGFTLYNSKANYIFFKNPYKIDIKSELVLRDILIRSCANYIGLDDSFYRIAVKNHEQNKRLVESLEEIIKSGVN